MLSWYCKPSLLEDLQGDLNEYFERNLKVKGARRARWIYIIDVFKFFRLYTIRKPEFINILIHWIMIGSYIKTSGRSIVRNKLFSAINIAGLAISMSVGLLMITVLVDMFSYDKFHENHSRIYRVISQYQFLGAKDNDFMATTSIRAGKIIQESFAAPQEVTILQRDFGGDMQAGEKKLPLSGFWANESFFNVFTFPLVQGNATTALKHPYSVVLTETSAKKIFGEGDVVGKILVRNGTQEYTITGVMKDVPRFSHMHFDMLGSLSTYEDLEKNNPDAWKWDNMWNAWVYVLLPEGSDLKNFKENLDKLSSKEDQTVKNTHIELAIQPLDEIMMGDDLGNQIGTTMGRTLMLVFGALSFVVLLSACFNYTNLSIARSLRRSREVGIRKVIGALRGHVIGQFIVEAAIISICALIVAFFIFLLVKPHFINMQPDLQELLVLDISPEVVACFIGFAVLIGIAAGFFPAFFFSKINAIQVLKDASSMQVFRKLTMRKVLIVFQYSISLMLITGTIIIYQQYTHYLAFDLGFNTENILNIRLQGNKAELLKKELSELPEVKGISQSVLVTSVGNYWGNSVKNPANPEDSAFVFANLVDENYIPLHGLPLLAGKNFRALADSATESELIVNTEVLKRFNISDQNPAKALGEVLTVNGKELQIVGVVKDFQYSRANAKMGTKEVMLRYSKHEVEYLNVKILSADLPATYARIESIWKEIDNVHSFEAKFFDDQIEEAFSGFSASLKLIGFISFLAVCIASMGLLGMVVFTTETRIREVSIRKVLGASEGSLLYLLSKGFIILLMIATCIAIPATYLFFDRIMFPTIANHLPLDITSGLTAVFSVMFIAIIMIASQTLKVSRSNPAEVLKSE
ncbi:MAG TPA: ABC transporter permease [Ohtaekwangia sp.]